MKLEIEKDVALAPLTTLEIGGRARFFVAAKNEREIAEAVRFVRENHLKIFVLGGGSNVLISDRGFDGLVLQIAVKGVSILRESDNEVLLKVGAGEDWDGFCEFCAEKNLQGVECLSGIPGTVGGTPVQNVGAYGQEVAETIAAVRCFDRQTENFVELSNPECRFTYRASVFNTTEKNRYIVTAVTFALTSNGAPKIAYRDLREFFGDAAPNLIAARRAVLEIRRAKSMVVDRSDPNSKSAGSFFKNPIIARKRFAEIENRARLLGIESVPFYRVDEETVKIPAAWLIEKSGFFKGYEAGRAGISTTHTLAVVNLGDANAADVLNLKSEIQRRVEEKFGVRLQPEPVFIGFDTEND